MATRTWMWGQSGDQAADRAGRIQLLDVTPLDEDDVLIAGQEGGVDGARDDGDGDEHTAAGRRGQLALHGLRSHVAHGCPSAARRLTRSIAETKAQVRSIDERIATLMPYSVGWTSMSPAATTAVAAP